MILHLGVVDLPYATASGATTVQVAGWLESRYHVIETFYEIHKDAVAQDLTSGLTDALDNLLMGAPPGQNNPYGDAENEIAQRFRTFLTTKEIESLGIPGVPTAAAEAGRSLRFKNKKGATGRPSFVDTGLYENSFRAWVD